MKFNKEKFYKYYKQYIQDDGNIYSAVPDSEICWEIEDVINEIEVDLEDGNIETFPTTLEIFSKRYIKVDFKDLMEYVLDNQDVHETVCDNFNASNHSEVDNYINDYLKKNHYYDYRLIAKVDITPYIESEE